jgi:protein-tyrosine phosphatase
MYTKLYWIDKFENGGAIGIMPRLRGNDWLIDEVKRLSESGVKTVVSLLEIDEIQELGLRDEQRLCNQQQIEYINFPIKDRAIPSEQAAIDKLIKLLDDKVREGQKVMIHCRMGIGRATLIAAAVLIRRGLQTEKVIEKITKARELKVPDTDEQVLWLKRLEKGMNKNEA